MRLARRLFALIAALVAVVATAASNASAFDYPSRPVQLIVDYAAGGPLDTGARLIAQELSKRLGQSFIVANHPGASGIIATEEWCAHVPTAIPYWLVPRVMLGMRRFTIT